MKAEPEPFRVVLDTNILISAWGFKGDVTLKIWELVEEARIEVFLSLFIVGEFRRNLIKKAGFSPEEAERMSLRVEQLAHAVKPNSRLSIIQEKESDNRILECAIEAKAKVIFTGNMKHIRPLGNFQGIEILTSREFLEKFFPRHA